MLNQSENKNRFEEVVVMEKTMLEKVKQELFGGWTLFEKFYIPSLVLLQLVVYMIYPDSFWGMIAGVTGVLCVTFVAKGKISNYYFGFIQTGIMLVLGAQAFLIGETGENVFYFVTQFLGIKEWKKNMVKETLDTKAKEETEIVQTRKLTGLQWVYLIVSIAVLSTTLGYIFGLFNGTQPYIDATTLILAIFGQMLMVYRFRESWVIWSLLNVLSIWNWFLIGNMSLVILYVSFLGNSLYAYILWTKQANKAKLKGEVK